MELEDAKYHCIALHYYLLRTYNVAARISDVFFYIIGADIGILDYNTQQSHHPSYHPCVTASRRI